MSVEAVTHIPTDPVISDKLDGLAVAITQTKSEVTGGNTAAMAKLEALIAAVAALTPAPAPAPAPVPPTVLLAPVVVDGTNLQVGVKLSGTLPAPEGIRVALHVLTAAGAIAINADFDLSATFTEEGGVRTYPRTIPLGSLAVGNYEVGVHVYHVEAPYPEIDLLQNGPGVTFKNLHRIVGSFAIQPVYTALTVLPATLSQSGDSLSVGLKFGGPLPATGHKVQLHVIDAAGNLSLNADFALTEPYTEANGVRTYQRTVSMAGKADGEYRVGSKVYQDVSPYNEATGSVVGAGVTESPPWHVVGTFTRAAAAPAPAPSPSPAPAPAPGVDITLKPFASDSPWNTPIPANATYVAASDSRVQAFRNHGSPINIASDWYTQWVWYSKPTDPLQNVNVSVHNLDGMANDSYWGSRPRAGTVQVRFDPSVAHPDPGRSDGQRGILWSDYERKDAHMIIIDRAAGVSHEFYHMERDAVTGAFKAVAYVKVPLNGQGVNISGERTEQLTGSYFNPAFENYGWAACRAYGGSALPGLIRQNEILGNDMKHVLALLLPFELLGVAPNNIPIWPATHTEFHPLYAGSIILGQRFAIPRSVNLATMGLTSAGLTFARTLQEYGAYVVDSAGTINFNADGVAARPDALAIPGADLAKIKAVMTIVTPV